MKKYISRTLFIQTSTLILLLCYFHFEGTGQHRARSLGIPFDGTSGPLNAITDIAEIQVGHVTLISGTGNLKVGKGPIRTGVTVILPRGKHSTDPVFAAWFSLNGNGEMTGTTWVEESGFLEGPIAITNTHSVGIVRDALIAWQAKTNRLIQPWSLPLVAETYDGWLNDINGFHIKDAHVFEALDFASGGPVKEGNVGGGTGMICYGFKGGIGTASRKIKASSKNYIVAALVQANFGQRYELRIRGVPVGREIPEQDPWKQEDKKTAGGSIIIVIATDAPLLPHQLKRLARRASLGVARTGTISSNFSGDIFIAFSTANSKAFQKKGTSNLTMLSNFELDPVFRASVQVTEEAIINSLIAAKTITGINNRTVIALPQDKLLSVLKKYIATN